MSGAEALILLKRPVRRAISIAGLAYGVSFVLAAAQAFALARMLTALVTQGRLEIAACAVWLALTGARIGAGFVAEACAAAAGAALKKSARVRLARAALAAPIGASEPAARTIVSTLNDDAEALGGYASRYEPLRMAMGAGMAAALALAFSQSWLVGALLLVTGPLIPLFMALVGYQAQDEARDKLDALGEMSRYFLGRIKRLDVLRAFGAVDREADLLARRAEDHRAASVGVLRIAFLSSATIDLFATLSIALIAVYVGLSLLGLMPFSTGETITPAEGFAALLVAPEFYAPLRRFASAYHDRADALAAAEKLAPTFALETGAVMARKPAAAESVVSSVRLRDLRAGYPGGKAGQVLDFSARRGEIIALAGPSGVGKSAVLKTLAGLLAPLGGSVEIDGAAAPTALLGRSVYVGQSPFLIAGSVRENLLIARDDADVHAMGVALRRVGLGKNGDDLLVRRIGDIAAGVSGGEAHRLALARALFSAAPVLLLDEPTAHLDAQAERDLVVTLREIARDHVLIVATHSPRMRMAADRVIEMADA